MFNVSRFEKTHVKKELECEVVTPLFLGGANPQNAELRAPPLKGILRFWWRAVSGIENIKDLADEEGRIFGSTEKKSNVLLWIENIDAQSKTENLPPGKKVPVQGKTFPVSIIHYLAYGLFSYQMGAGNVFTKRFFPPQSRFKIVVQYPPSIESEITAALQSTMSFGGLGARSRNGFGSLHCPALGNGKFPNNGGLKPFTSFSKEALLFDKFGVHNTWVDALSEIGDVYRSARLKLESRHRFFRRAFVAMPIEAKNENIPDDIRNGRHAKPYFLHVNKTPEGRYRGQILFLPYQYKRKADDRTNILEEYKSVCAKMNEEIYKAMGGAS
ncbi:MAG TPA: type III-B CRISPR module RAMP protein Cmr1 [Syntrophales bacterium]|nr:type III-B CRISPR module RAMP protein Cmr1 [Syntrophales bacterium]HPC33701.1 type III-B CRISPR module RAMP protein Cmr1 [Syntrophales bacterium]HQG34148.1 type III-B CRISPR module RAMP protein Cmr1 [Syntrophales bacterium]